MRHPVAAGRPRRRRRNQGAFTLIELLAVMTIILILAGLILSIAGNANYKAATSRAQGEIQAMGTAIESYRTDNGAYPRVVAGSAGDTGGTNNTDKLDARSPNYIDPNGTAHTPTYSTTSLILYKLISGNYYLDSTGTLRQWTSSSTSNGAPVPKPTTYFNLNSSQLKLSTPTPSSGYVDPTTVTAITDPFGLSYGYSTAYQYNTEQNAANNVTTAPTMGNNPTYDLWSTAGYSSTAGKSYPTAITSAGTYSTLWVKNW